MTSDIVPIPSELESMIDEWAEGFIGHYRVRDLPDKILELGAKYGIDKEVIRKRVWDKLTALGYSDRSMRDMMPKPLRLHNYPETRKKVELAKSANSDQQPKPQLAPDSISKIMRPQQQQQPQQPEPTYEELKATAEAALEETNEPAQPEPEQEPEQTISLVEHYQTKARQLLNKVEQLTKENNELTAKNRHLTEQNAQLKQELENIINDPVVGGWYKLSMKHPKTTTPTTPTAAEA